MKKLFTALQIAAWDTYTIKHTPIKSIDLMERASAKFVHWFSSQFHVKQKIYVFCGPGNNSGDGFAICRLLTAIGYAVTPYLINTNAELTTDCKVNLKKIAQVKDWALIKSTTVLKNDIIIDAVFGTGLSRPLTNEYATLICHLNNSNGIKISVDIPSGMFCDTSNNKDAVIFKADHVLTFETPKRSFFFKENQKYISDLNIINIGLHPLFYKQTHCNWHQIYTVKDIPNYHKHTLETHLEKELIATHGSTYTTNNAIAALTQKAIQTQKMILLKSYSDFYFTPIGSIYIILNL